MPNSHLQFLWVLGPCSQLHSLVGSRTMWLGYRLFRQQVSFDVGAIASLEGGFESLYCPFCQPIRGGVVGCARDMANPILLHEFLKFRAGEGRPVVGNLHLRQPMRGEDGLKLPDHSLGCWHDVEPF